jgi:hypothetical protein
VYNDSVFGSFEGLDNRRTLIELFSRMGHGVPESIACIYRMRALERLIKLSGTGFAEKMVELTPLNTVEAYFAFVAVCGQLGVDINRAAKQLEQEVRSGAYRILAD